MSTLFTLFDLPWLDLVELAVLSFVLPILLLYVVFILAMLAQRGLNWSSKYADNIYAPWLLVLGARIVGLLCVVVLFFAALYDWLINHTSAVLLFWDRAREPMVTGRLERYKNSTDGQYGWRKKFASSFCLCFLDWADPNGRHCK